jgi:two-component system alkaline phosphatase synthesis response regulator PhoP
MKDKPVLLIEDESDIAEVICFHLERDGFSSIFVRSAEEGLEVLKTTQVSLIILDIMLPGMDGLEFLRRLHRTSNAYIPVMISSAKSDVVDIVTGLEVGAVDYLAKPFHPKVLVAKVKSILRRNLHGSTELFLESKNNSVVKDSQFQFSTLKIDIERFEASIEGNKLGLTATEFKILQFLAERKGKVFTRYQIVDNVHGTGHSVTDRSIDVQILALRKKLGHLSSLIETVRGVGYRFADK